MASSVARRVAQRVLGSNAASAAARAAWSAGQPTPETHPDLLQPGELLPGLAAAEFAARRAALAALLPPGAVALLPAAPITYMAGGAAFPLFCCCHALHLPCHVCLAHDDRRSAPLGTARQHGAAWHVRLGRLTTPLAASWPAAGVIPYPFRQSADFLYLTGITQPYALAVLDCDARYRCVCPHAWYPSGTARSVAGGCGRLLRIALNVQRRLAPPLLQPAAHLAYVCTWFAPLCHPLGSVSKIPMPGHAWLGTWQPSCCCQVSSATHHALPVHPSATPQAVCA